jgi:hypothetical protein
MTYTAHPRTADELSESTWHVITAIMAVAGIIAAAIGALIEFGPTDGTLTLFGWTWTVAEISELWAPLLMIGGGLVTALPMGIESTRDWSSEHARWLVTLEALAALIGIAAVVVGVVLLF